MGEFYQKAATCSPTWFGCRLFARYDRVPESEVYFMNKLFATNNSWAMLLVRLPLAVNMIVHGWAKVSNVT